MTNGVAIENDITYLFLQWIGWDYNFINVILADIFLIIMFFVIVFALGILGIILGIIK